MREDSPRSRTTRERGFIGNQGHHLHRKNSQDGRGTSGKGEGVERTKRTHLEGDRRRAKKPGVLRYRHRVRHLCQKAAPGQRERGEKKKQNKGASEILRRVRKKKAENKRNGRQAEGIFFVLRP